MAGSVLACFHRRTVEVPPREVNRGGGRFPFSPIFFQIFLFLFRVCFVVFYFWFLHDTCGTCDETNFLPKKRYHVWLPL